MNYSYQTQFSQNSYYQNVYNSQQNANTPLPPGVSNYMTQTYPPGVSNYTSQLYPPGVTNYMSQPYPPGVSNYATQLYPLRQTPALSQQLQSQQNFAYYNQYQYPNYNQQLQQNPQKIYSE